MLDPYLRPLIDKPLQSLARLLVDRGTTADQVTLIGFGVGCLTFIALFFQAYIVALIGIGLNRLCDGLDGAVAKETGATDFGGYLDIVLDMIFYAGFVFFFCLGVPDSFAFGAFLIFSFIGTSASFLTYAIIAAKRGEDTQARGEKSFYHAAGLMEGTETIIFMVLACLLPQYFEFLALMFAFLCWITVGGRIKLAHENFTDHS